MLRGPGSASALGTREASDGTIHVVDENCSRVHLRSFDKVTVWFANGTHMTAPARRFCTDRTGIGLSKTDQGFCFEGDIVPWKHVASVTIDQVDDGTVLFAVALGLPIVVVLALTGVGGAMNHLGDGSPESPGKCANVKLPLPAEQDPSEAARLFSRTTSRQGDFRPSLRVDGGTCLVDRRCLLGSARGGITLFDLIDVSSGVRWESGRTTRLMGTLGFGLQGRFRGAQWLAMYTGVQFGVGEGLRVAPNVGLRFRIIEGFWLGAMPLGFTYFAKYDPRGEKTVLYTPSVDVGYEF